MAVPTVENGERSASPPKNGKSPVGVEYLRMQSEGQDYQYRASFPGKNAQMKEVTDILSKSGLIPQESVAVEVDWLYNKIGITDFFFSTEEPQKIADFLLAIYGSKLQNRAKGGKDIDIVLEHELDDGGVYLCNSQPGVSLSSGPQFEQKIDTKYLNPEELAYRVETYRSKGVIIDGSAQQLRAYFVEKVEFENRSTDPMETDIAKIAGKGFFDRVTPRTIELYQSLIQQAVRRTGPVVAHMETPQPGEHRIVIAYRRGTAPGFFSSLSHIYHYYDLFSVRKFVEQFANGLTIISIYLQRLPGSQQPPPEQTVPQMVKEISLLYLIPVTSLQKTFLKKEWSLREVAYAYAGWRFCEHFLNRLGSEYTVLTNILEKTNESHLSLLAKLKMRLRQDTFTSKYIKEVIQTYPDILRKLYRHFANTFHVSSEGSAGGMTRSFSTMQLNKTDALGDEEIKQMIRKAVNNSNEQLIFECMLTFNNAILKTNFYTPTKVALSFRLNPSFLPELEYPRPVFGMFFVLGREFRGFHVRFADVARGGIRIIRSANTEVFNKNVTTLFDENYNLASTQQNKNKDIPEGGSKGTILLGMDSQTPTAAVAAFKKYVDALLDLLLVGQSPGIKDPIVDRYQKHELLFLGPDEGTADLMNWASQHAKARAAPFWKAFTTGKSPELGGIPHDTYGMTTRSVHQYVLGILEKEGVSEESITKMQTGGPDGDLGSNEIRISKDKTVCIVDGSGVIYDPEGLNRPEITRLATARKMIEHFDISLLGPKGFRVLVAERDVTLPDGTVVESGMNFRNGFHLSKYATATLFVPCGGRPESVNINNVAPLLGEGENPVPRFKYIVEGANLFFTQHARQRLEKAGVILFKDASANKGGVTSSSLEVLSGLALPDELYTNNMTIVSGKVPEFYQRYVVDVQNIIERNARLEFEAIWSEYKRTGRSRIAIADELSLAIVKMTDQLMDSRLWDDMALRRQVLSAYCPPSLLGLLGLEQLMERVPETYLKAIFAAYLASRFVYTFGLESSPFAFYEFINSFIASAQKKPMFEA